MNDTVCPLCERPIPPTAPQSLHHLIPKLKGGKGGPTILIHHICHKEIHATLSEAELARSYASVDALRAHPRLAKFFQWSQNAPRSSYQKLQAGAVNDKHPQGLMCTNHPLNPRAMFWICSCTIGY